MFYVLWGENARNYEMANVTKSEVFCVPYPVAHSGVYQDGWDSGSCSLKFLITRINHYDRVSQRGVVVPCA